MTTAPSPTGFEDGGALSVATVVHEDGATVWVAGELDVNTAGPFREVLAATQAQHVATLVIDLSRLRFIDSNGLHLLVEALKRQRETGGEVLLRSPRPQTRRVLKIVGLTQVFTIV